MGLFDHLIPKPEKQSGFRRVADIPLELASGVARGVKFTADAFGAGNAVSAGAGAVDEFARSLLSAQAQADDRQIAQIMAAAEDAGIWEQVKAAAQAFGVSPIRTTVNALGTSVPTIAATMIPGVGQAGAAARIGMLGTMGAAQGAGVVKGSIYEAVKAEQIKAGVPEAEAEAIATRAQEYGGENTDSIVGGAALGGAAAATGLQPIAARMLQTRSVLAQAASDATPGLLARTGLGIAKEAPLEAAQGGQEQLATNVALQREGFDVPTFRGVAGSAALEGLASAPGGAVFGALDRPAPTPEPKPEAEPSIAPLLIGNTPDPYISFPDGTVGKRADVERYVQSLPEDKRAAARAKLLGLEPQQATVADVLAAETVDEAAEAALNASRKAVGLKPVVTPIPTGEAAELLPTGEASEVQPGLVLDGKSLFDFGLTREQRRERLRRKIGRPPAVEATEMIPTPDDVQELESIPTPEVVEDIPVGQAAEVLPVGESTEMIPTGDASEMQRSLIPIGRATEIEPETIQADDLLTGDGMPYGSKVAANVRARREGLGPANVVEIPGAGWVVRPQPTTLGTSIEGRPNNTRGTTAQDVLRSPNVKQPDVAATAGQPAASGDGRGADPGRGGMAVGSVPPAPGAVDRTAPGVGAGARAAGPVADGVPAEQALKGPDTRERSIRETWSAEPRNIGEWTPMTVRFRDTTTPMLAIQRKARTDGNAPLTLRAIRTGTLVTGDDPQPLVFTFKLTEANKVEQVGRARVPTPEDIAQWEGAGFAVPGKKAEAPKPAADEQDRQGLREEDRRARSLAGAAEELTSQIQGDIAENDFAADEVMPGLRLFAEQAKVPADELREEVLKRIRKSGMKRGDIKRVERALDPTKAPAPAPEPTPEPAPQVSAWTPEPPAPAPTNPPAPAAQTRPEELIELRKRASVLKQLLECLG